MGSMNRKPRQPWPAVPLPVWLPRPVDNTHMPAGEFGEIPLVIKVKP